MQSHLKADPQVIRLLSIFALSWPLKILDGQLSAEFQRIFMTDADIC